MTNKCESCGAEKKLHILQEINGVCRYTGVVENTEDLRKLFKRKTLIPNMDNLDEMTITVKWVLK